MIGYFIDIEKTINRYIKINLGSSSNGEFTLRPVLSTSSYSARKEKNRVISN